MMNRVPLFLKSIFSFPLQPDPQDEIFDQKKEESETSTHIFTSDIIFTDGEDLLTEESLIFEIGEDGSLIPTNSNITQFHVSRPSVADQNIPQKSETPESEASPKVELQNESLDPKTEEPSPTPTIPTKLKPTNLTSPDLSSPSVQSVLGQHSLSQSSSKETFQSEPTKNDIPVTQNLQPAVSPTPVVLSTPHRTDLINHSPDHPTIDQQSSAKVKLSSLRESSEIASKDDGMPAVSPPLHSTHNGMNAVSPPAARKPSSTVSDDLHSQSSDVECFVEDTTEESKILNEQTIDSRTSDASGSKCRQIG